MFHANQYWITIAEVKEFTEAADDVFTEDERDTLIELLALDPLAGEAIPDTGGVRRIRWAAKSQGRRGGANVVYFFRDLNTPVYLLALFRKGESMRLSMKEKFEMRLLVQEIVEAYGIKRLIQIASDGAA